MAKPLAKVSSLDALLPALFTLAALAAVPGSTASATASELPPLRVSGNQLIAGDRPVRLRGLDWGWWHLKGTQYSEPDMKNAAHWGANVVRLSFSCTDLQTDSDQPVARPEGYQELDDVVRWAKDCGIYVILDMHVVPGGQSSASYVLDGRNELWKSRAAQDRFVELWKALAQRYRRQTNVAAYELVNEPGSKQKTPALLREIDGRAIDTIRTVDPDKIIVVGGDRGSGPAELTAAMKFADPNIVYTFHWYLGAGGNEDWIGTVPQPINLTGTCEWTKIEQTVTAPPGADHMSALFRSTGNTGSAWFDDVTISDSRGRVLEAQTFDDGPGNYKPQAQPQTMAFDPAVGHDRLGSLKVSHSTLPNDWAGWMNKRVSIQPGGQYRVTAWAKLERATGDASQAVMFVRLNTRIDQDAFAKKIVPALEFSKTFNVPLWVGEFGCDTSNLDLQPQWVAACISLFENNHISWTYWNDKETSGPEGMALQGEHHDGSDYPVNERLLKVLRDGWLLNAQHEN